MAQDEKFTFLNVIKFLQENEFPDCEAETLGEYLNIPPSKIKTMKYDSNTSRRLLHKVIDHWFQNDSEKSWQKLAEAVELCDYSNIAEVANSKQGSTTKCGVLSKKKLICSAIEMLENKFKDLHATLLKELEAKEVSADDLLLQMKHLPLSISIFVNCSRIAKKSFVNLNELFTHFNGSVWTILDPVLLEYFINDFGSKELIVDMKDYSTELKKFKVKTQILDIISCWKEAQNDGVIPNFEEITFLLPINYTLAELDERRRQMNTNTLPLLTDYALFYYEKSTATSITTFHGDPKITKVDVDEVRQASTPESMPPAHSDSKDEFLVNRKQKREPNYYGAAKSLKTTISTGRSEVYSQPADNNPNIHGTQEFVNDVTEAVSMKKEIKRKMASIILKGLPAAGKSTLLNSLLKKPFQENSFSTGISDGIVVVDIQPTSTLTSATSDNSSWEVIDFDKSMYSQLEDCKQFLPSAEEMSIKQNAASDPLSQTSVVRDNIEKVLRAHNIKSIEDLKLKNCLYIRDTGGQVEFQESLTLLVYGPSIFIFVLRTDIDIDQKTIIRYRSPSGEIINEYQSSISTVDALVQFLSSVSAIDTTEEGVFQEEGAYKSYEPVVFIVGTHIDLLKSDDADSVIAEMNESLHRIICEHGFSRVVCYAENASSKVMYTVNNKSVEDDNFKILRSGINEYICSRHEFMVLYPISYLLLCLELQNIKSTVISIVKFRQLASKFSIESKQVSHLLHFLHFRMGIIQYYDIDNLSDIVIKEPQVLFNKVTDLLVKTFLSSKALKKEQHKSFHHRGVLDAAVLETILGDSKNEITAKQFLAFMVRLRLAVPFKDKSGIEKYFIPSVLNHVPALTSEESKTNIAPLAIFFKLGHCPQGLFGVLLSHIMNPDKNHEVSFDLLDDKIYQDQVFLCISSSEYVRIMSMKRNLSHIKITIYSEDSSPDTESESSRNTAPTTVCTTVRSILHECLQLSMMTLHYDDKKLLPKFCLACPTCNSWQDCEAVRFCKTCRTVCPVPSSGMFWLNQKLRPVPPQQSISTSNTSENQVTDFTVQHLTLLKWTDSGGKNHSLRLRDEMSSRWHEVGDLLGVATSRQDGIHTQRMGDVRLCCRDIFLDWLQMEEKSYPASWEGLLVLLEDLQLNNLAKKLNEALDCYKKTA